MLKKDRDVMLMAAVDFLLPDAQKLIWIDDLLGYRVEDNGDAVTFIYADPVDAVSVAVGGDEKIEKALDVDHVKRAAFLEAEDRLQREVKPLRNFGQQERIEYFASVTSLFDNGFTCDCGDIETVAKLDIHSDEGLAFMHKNKTFSADMLTDGVRVEIEQNCYGDDIGLSFYVCLVDDNDPKNAAGVANRNFDELSVAADAAMGWRAGA